MQAESAKNGKRLQKKSALAVGNLKSLVDLNLHKCPLPSLPTEVGTLSSLRRLTLTSCQLAALPTELGNLGSLTHLSAGGNWLVQVPSELGNLGSLTHLFLEKNKLTSVPSELGNLKIGAMAPTDAGATHDVLLSLNLPLVTVPKELAGLRADLSFTQACVGFGVRPSLAGFGFSASVCCPYSASWYAHFSGTSRYPNNESCADPAVTDAMGPHVITGRGIQLFKAVATDYAGREWWQSLPSAPQNQDVWQFLFGLGAEPSPGDVLPTSGLLKASIFLTFGRMVAARWVIPQGEYTAAEEGGCVDGDNGALDAAGHDCLWYAPPSLPPRSRLPPRMLAPPPRPPPPHPLPPASSSRAAAFTSGGRRARSRRSRGGST